MNTPANVLIIDDDESIRTACIQTLQEAGFRARAVEDGSCAFEKIERESFDVVLLDLKMPGISGMDVLKKLKTDEPDIQVIVITGYASIDYAVEAGRMGVFDFLCKPFSPEILIATVARAAKTKRNILEDSCVFMALNEQPSPVDSIIGKSKPMLELMRLIKQVAPMDSSVLITGETGSGKELAARTLHRLSNRSRQPFVVVDCGSLVETLFESEMFGHVKGAFTGADRTRVGRFEAASRGDIFLDEIGDIPLSTQVKLLRVLQEKEIEKVGDHQPIDVDVRVLAATNKDLNRLMEEGRFREDLYYRIGVIPIYLPPLRERREDIPLLIDAFINRIRIKTRKKISGMSREALELLIGHDWPGNVRELINAIEYAFVLCADGDIMTDHLPGNLTGKSLPLSTGQANSLPRSTGDKKKHLLEALKRTGGNKSEAARILGVSRVTLWKWLKAYDIRVDKKIKG